MIRTGIIGTGRIARRFVPEALHVDGIGITAVYNQHPGSAERFANEVCGGTGTEVRAFDKTEGFWERVDAAYIASPHETHFDHIMQSLDHGKHVLCEKPMALSRGEALECFRAAGEKGLVLLEGIKTAYCPGYKKVLETVRSGIIGDVRYIDSCFTKLEDPESRELTDRKYGGSFTELGSYVALPLSDLLPEDRGAAFFTSITNESGIDVFTKLELEGAGVIATAECGLGVKAEGRLLIGGTKGFIRVDAPWWKTTHFEVHFEDTSKTVTFDEVFEGDGLRYETAEFAGLIEGSVSGNETMERSKRRSLFMAGLMEEFLYERDAGEDA